MAPRAYSVERVARDHLDRVAALEPIRQGLGGAVGQQVGHASGFQVNQNSPLCLPFLQRPVVHAQHSGRYALGQRKGAHEAQHGVGTGRHAEPVQQPRTSFTAAGNPNPALGGGETPGAASPRGQQVRQRLGECPAWTDRVTAIEPPDQEVETDLLPKARKIGLMPAVSAMDG